MSEIPATPRSRRKWLLRLAALALTVMAFLALLTWFFATPLMENVLLPAAAHRMLHANIDTTGLDIYPILKADTVQFSDFKTPNAPVLSISNLEAPWRWPARDGRYIDSFSASDATLQIQSGDTMESNLGFVIGLLNAPSSGIDPMPYIPRTIDIAQIKAGIYLQDWHTRLQGLALAASIDAIDRAHLRLYANDAAIEWRNPLSNAVESSSFELSSASVTGTPAGYEAQLELHAPDLADITLAARMADEGAMHIDVPAATLYPAYWRGLAAGLTGLDLQFDPIQIEGAAFEGSKQGATWENWTAQAGLHTPHFSLAVPEIAAAEGPLSISLSGSQEEALHATVSASFGEGQHLSLSSEGKDPISWSATSEGIPAVWLAPAAARVNNAVLNQFIQESHLALNAAGTWTSGTLKGNAELNFTQAGRALKPLVLNFERGADHFEAALESRQEDALLRLALRQQQDSGMLVEASATALPIAAWWPQPLPLGLDGLITASVSADFTDVGNVPWQATLQSDRIGSTATGWPESMPLQASLTGAIETPGTVRVSGEAAFGGGNMLKLEDTRYAAGTLTTSLECAIYLEDWAAFGGVPDLYGDLVVQASLQAAGEQLTGNFTATAERLGHGDFALPYRSAITLQSQATWNTATRAGVLNELQMALPPGTAISSASVDLNPLETGYDIAMKATRIESDLAQLAKLGYAESAEGTFNADLPLLHAGGGELRVEATGIAITAATLFLSDGGPRFFDLSLSGAGNYAPGEQITGALQASRVESGGARITAISGTWNFGDAGLKFSPLNATLFGGAVEASAVLQPLTEGLPITFNATFENVDLAAFTTEMKPPDVNLTGIVRGTVQVAIAAGQLTLFEAHLEANEGVTINRDMVESILLSQQFGGVTGAAVTRTLRKVLGDEPQRPFDSAAMDLTLEDGRITGDARLESESLGLTVDIKADPKAILEALRARQQNP
ncbi:MAG: YdbH domain-containing protein [Candidatus Hydrogenedentes bacterium]|nr:YdbH domain-containing protein [Candidatus Hydrogenedentota bacterium]